MNRKSRVPKASLFRVQFVRLTINNSGKSFPCIIDRIEIRRAKSPERALFAAQRRFERRHHIANWQHLAHDCRSEGLTAG